MTWQTLCLNVSGLIPVLMNGSRPVVEVVRLGLVSYQEALRLQQVYVNRHRSGPAHALLLCQHPPVYTTGIRHKPYPAHLLDHLHLLGADVHRTNRGGLITFHGPGQLVCYPVLNLSCFKKVWSGLFWSWMCLNVTGVTLTSDLILRVFAGTSVSWRRPSSPFAAISALKHLRLLTPASGSETTRSALSVRLHDRPTVQVSSPKRLDSVCFSVRTSCCSKLLVK